MSYIYKVGGLFENVDIPELFTYSEQDVNRLFELYNPSFNGTGGRTIWWLPITSTSVTLRRTLWLE